MTYKVVLTHTDEGYSVGCPELPGCWSQGETKEDAIANIREAIGEYLSVQPQAELQNEVEFVEVPEAVVSVRNQSNHNETSGEGRPVKFVVKPIASLLFPPEWTSHKVEDLLRIVNESPKP